MNSGEQRLPIFLLFRLKSGADMLKVPNNTHFLCVIFGTFGNNAYLCNVIQRSYKV